MKLFSFHIALNFLASLKHFPLIAKFFCKKDKKTLRFHLTPHINGYAANVRSYRDDYYA